MLLVNGIGTSSESFNKRLNPTLSHWVWWVGEIIGACLAVILTRMAFAPVFTGEDESSGVWWWRLYLYMNTVLDEEDYQTAGQGGFDQLLLLERVALNVSCLNVPKPGNFMATNYSDFGIKLVEL